MTASKNGRGHVNDDASELENVDGTHQAGFVVLQFSFGYDFCRVREVPPKFEIGAPAAAQ